MKVTRTGSLKAGFQYRLLVKRAVTQEDWEKKCALTKQIASSQGEPYRTWLFNDLTGYLERWPQGEKAGGCMEAALSTGMGASCGYIRDELTTGRITIGQLRVYQERNALLLDLGRRVPPPALDGIRYKSYVSSLESLEKTNKCIEEITGQRIQAGKEQ